MTTFDMYSESSKTAASLLEIRLLGVPEARMNGEVVSDFRSSKVRALLYYLAKQGQPQSRSTLVALLWGDTLEASGRNSLNKAFTNLRKLIPEFIVTDRATASLNVESSCHIDAVAFEGQTKVAVESRNIELLTETTNLYAGDFLEGFHVADAPDFEEWVRNERMRLSRVAASALSTLSEWQIEDGDLEEAQATIRKSLQLEPWNEVAHQSLMNVLVAAGHRSAALAQYDQCCEILARELDVEPSRQTKDLYEKIRSDQIEQPARTRQQAILDKHVAVSSDEQKNNLPTQTTPFVGRTSEMQELYDLLINSHSRLITIVAPGGMGKTRLAIEVGIKNLSNYKDGVYFVPLVALTNTDQIVENIADILSYNFASDNRTRRQQLRDYLQNKNTLLILDNFEHLLPNIDLLIDLLSGAPEIKFLVTSRERLSLSGETVYTLQGLDWSDDGQLASEESDTASLFAQSAQRVRSDFAPTPEDLRAIFEIGQLVVGMPLAIILAASWIELLSPAEIAADIKHGLDLLDAELRDLPERQRSMRTVFEQTWQRLSSVEQDALMRLTVFRESFTREAAQYVSHANLKLLKSLVNKSLVRVTQNSRYDIQELLRQFAHEKLAQEPDTESTARHLHSTYYCNWLGEHRNDFLWREQLKYYDEIVADVENIRLAWQNAVERKDVMALDKAWEPYWQFLDWRGAADEVIWAFESAAKMLSALEDSDADRNSVIRSLEGLCWTLCGQRMHHRDPTKSLKLTRKGIELLRVAQSMDNSRMIWGLANLGWATQCDLGTDNELTKGMSIDDVRDFFEEALTIATETGNDHGRGTMLNMIGFTYTIVDQIDKAEAYLQDGKRVLASLGEYRWRSMGLSNLPSISLTNGDYAMTRSLADESLEIARLINNRHSMCNALFIKGLLAHVEGNYREGVEWFSESVEISLKSGERPLLIPYQAWLASAYWCLGQYQKAEDALEECRVHIHSMHRSTSRYIAALGRFAYAQGNWGNAEKLQRQAIDEFRPAYGDTFDTLKCDLGDTLVALGNPDAKQYFIDSLQVDKTKRIVPRVLRALVGLSSYYAQFDQMNTALKLASLVREHSASWHEHRQQAQSVINIAKEQLSQDNFASYAEMGKEAELWSTVDELLVGA